MKELIQLVSYKEMKRGNLIHNSSYTLRFNEIGLIKKCLIYCFEYEDGRVENNLYSAEEYYIKLKNNPELFSQLSKYELESLRLIIGHKEDFILYNTDYKVNSSTYYFIYNFRKIEVEVDNKLNINVYENEELRRVKCDFIPKKDYITLAALVRELSNEEVEIGYKNIKYSYIF